LKTIFTPGMVLTRSLRLASGMCFSRRCKHITPGVLATAVYL
jgi:hypothetical protein